MSAPEEEPEAVLPTVAELESHHAFADGDPDRTGFILIRRAPVAPKTQRRAAKRSKPVRKRAA